MPEQKREELFDSFFADETHRIDYENYIYCAKIAKATLSLATQFSSVKKITFHHHKGTRLLITTIVKLVTTERKTPI